MSAVDREAILPRLAEALRCDTSDVSDIFTLSYLNHVMNSHGDNVREMEAITERRAKLARLIESAADALAAEDADFQDALDLDFDFPNAETLRQMASAILMAGHKTPEPGQENREQAIRRLNAALGAGQVETLSTAGGKNHRGRLVATAVARVFDNLGRPVTFGHKDGDPCGDFPRAVKAALAACGLPASQWRQPAYDVWKSGRNHPLRVANAAKGYTKSQ